jgi:LmbE family N-acetylglucosaminyl deacetylase
VSDTEMVAIRRREQREAAEIGRYSAVVQLGYPSKEIRDDPTGSLAVSLGDVLARTSPRQVCTHNLVDRHPTHVAVALATITALRALPAPQQPDEVYGCEGWRALDWLAEGERVALSSSGYEKLAIELIEVFDSQVSGGKRYDLAAVGRRRANATLAESHEVDTESQVTLAMDLTPLIRDPSLDVTEFALAAVDRFRDEVARTLARLTR